jgi:hypothetical protein
MKRQPEMLLSQRELAAGYAKTLRFVSMSRRLIPSDETRQRMADAVREFYGLLETKLESKSAAQKFKRTQQARRKRVPNLLNRDAA